MRTKIIVTTIVVILGLLAFRLFYLYRDNRAEERKAYVQSLNFKFSGRVDTLVHLNSFNNGIALFHIEKGEFDTLIEKEMNRDLEFNRDLCFIILTRSGNKGIRLDRLNSYKKGDSLVVDTNKDQLEFFRDGRLLTSSKISEVVSRSPL